MAENKRPQGSTLIDNNNNNNNHNNETSNGNKGGGNRSEKHIDFTSFVSRKGRTNRSSPMPMATRPRNVLEDADRDREMEDLAMVVDTQRMQLISPPPEEMLRRNPRSSGQFTPSLLADPSPRPGSTTKRKRTTQQQQQAPVTSSVLVRDTDATMDPDSPMAVADADVEPAETEMQQPVEATPNPKPRKQGRHARMASMGSPTRASFGSPPTGSSSDSSNPRTKDLNTTPSKPKRVVVQSPHTKNPDADWIPPVSSLALSANPARRAVLSARAPRRSATPIPPYEPPPDVFTPPRVVYMSPAPRTEARSANRKTKTPTTKAKKVKGKTHLRVVTTQVKQELPDDIDLMAPMPPPSPSDDPLLLSGPPEPPAESSPLRRVVRRREASVQAEVQSFNEVLPPSSPEPPLDSEDVQAVNAFDWDKQANGSMETEDSMMRFDDPRDAEIDPVRLFDLEDMQFGSGDVGGWSDSDDDEVVQTKGKEKGKEGGEGDVVEGEGEFTGRWRMMKVRTKQDPPSSATRGRMELWGRPISPFPKVKKLDLLGEEDEEEVGEQENEPSRVEEDAGQHEPEELGQQEVVVVQEQEEDEEEEEEVRRMSVEPEEPVNPGEAPQEDEEEEREVRQMSVEFDDDEEQDASNQELQLPVELTRQPSPAPTIVDRRSSNIFAFPSLESPEAGPSNYSLKPVLSNTFPQNDALVDQDSQMLDVAPEEQDVLDGDDEDSGSDLDNEPGLVKITSADPRAAARAAAILKQHDYDCYTKIVMKKKRLSEVIQRRASHSGIEGLAKETRRRDLADARVSKSTSKNRRRSTLGMGVIGDRVFIPGTPVMTLPELLKEAEVEVGRELEHDHQTSPVWSARATLEGSGQRDPFKTPLPDKGRARLSTRDRNIADPQSPDHDAGKRAWTREEWKYLDACFTDERLDLGVTIEGAPEGTLASVEMVSIDAVVDRFIAFVGGEEIVQSHGDAWSRDNLMERTRALQRKQRAGNVAHPTTPRSVSFAFSPTAASTSAVDSLGGKRRMPSMEVPDFTPLGRRAGPPPRKSRPPVLPPPVVHKAPFSSLPVEEERQPSKRIPPTLLAPRYSHLLEEAISISEEGKLRQATAYQGQEAEKSQEEETESNSDSRSFEYSQDDISQEIESLPEATTTPPMRHADPPNTTIGKSLKGFLFSYLPTLSSKTPASLPSRKASAMRQPGLPLPPLDILEKPRGPVMTPARQPLPKAKHPKELVHLHPAPAPVLSALPRLTKPRRIVELHHLPPPQEKPVVLTSLPRLRRSSGSSVKDLVKGFEEMQKVESKGGSNSLQRVRSIGELRKADTRPRWKP